MIKAQAQLGLEKFRLAQPPASKTRVDLSSEDQKVEGRQTTEMQITFAAFFPSGDFCGVAKSKLPISLLAAAAMRRFAGLPN